MTEKPAQQAIILKIDSQPLQLWVQNLRTGEQLKFADWETLLAYLQRLSKRQGLR